MKKIVQLALYCFCVSTLQAQEGLNQEVIDVVKDFRPKVMQAEKIKTQPVFVDTSKVSEKLSYQIRLEDFTVQQKTDSLHALLLNRPHLDELYHQRLDVGIGSLLSPYISYDVSNGRSTKNVYHAYINYDGSFSNRMPVNNKYSDLRLGAAYKHPFNIGHLKSDFAFQNLSRFDSLDRNIQITPLDFSSSIEFKDSTRFYIPDLFDASASLLLYDGSFAERKITLKSLHDNIPIKNLKWRFDNVLAFQKSDDVNKLHWKSKVKTNTKIDVFDVNLALGFDLLDGSFKLFPEIKAQYPIKKGLYSYFELGGNRELSSLDQLYLKNPYLPLMGSSGSSLGKYLEDNTSYFSRLGLNGKLFETLIYQLSITAKTDDQFMHFIRISNPAEASNMSITPDYTSLNSVQVHAEIEAQWNDQLHFWLKGDFRSYDKHLSYTPETEIGFYIAYQYNTQWFIRSSMRCMGAREVLTPSLDDNDKRVKSEDLQELFDLNLKLTYSHDKQFNFYLEALNLFDQEVVIWQQNPVLGRQFIIGSSYRF